MEDGSSRSLQKRNDPILGQASYRSARAAAFVISLSHRTELATATQNTQSPPLSATVPKARCRNGTCTTRTCSATDRASPPTASVGEQTSERASLVRSRIEHVENLKQHQRRERHRLRVAQVAGALDEPAGQRRVEHEQRAGRHDHADEDDAAPHPRRDARLRRRARRLAASAPRPPDRRPARAPAAHRSRG